MLRRLLPLLPVFVAGLLKVHPVAAAPDSPAAPDRTLLIDGGMVVTMDVEGTILDGGAVLIEGDRIAALLKPDAPRPAEVQVIDATGHVVIPGLVNTHGHAAMSLLRGMADDLPLMTWLNDHIFPAEAALVAPDFVYWGTLLSSVEMLKSGTTTFTDMYYFRDQMARATIDAGIRVVTGPVVVGFPTPDFPTPEAALKDAAVFMEQYRDHPTLVPSVSAHALYTTPLSAVEAAFRVAEAHDAVFQIHILEDPSEDATARQATGMGVVEALDSIGALRPGTVLAHSIYLSDEDVERIAGGGAGIAHNPQSNMKLGIPKAAPVTAALAAGIPVGLGTDGPASNNDLDLFDEMDAAAKIQKFQLGDPAALPAETVFRMATMGGARVLNLHDQIGSLEPGKRADVVLVDMQRPGLTPLYHVYSHLVYAARGSDVATVIVNGRIVVQDRRILTVDEAAVMERAHGFADRVREVMSELH
ncbi:MAG: amidohydrolase [Synechococcus sp. SB0666_bin_14]|nr:amidohydrolase [Synechococcus sp. SB0666_bin_14]MYA91734.1 amidohydrolase [Synechococcus sp. SB0663_bin_10]MYG47159.1 amidohydrolase [Synechococcus sp. SB0675_bin_6]MYJ60518.1 amidohydrolase [Synechococcus sp. SB0672_bin_6]MYK91408.1 amidohydrolase [Synechococcus sp. SB0669_bin_8]